VLYVQSGSVKLSVLSKTGKEAVIAMIGPGDFFGEGCLAGQPVRMGSATAVTAGDILRIETAHMVRVLRRLGYRFAIVSTASAGVPATPC
jgi:CRP-like cAMP-binding protein